MKTLGIPISFLFLAAFILPTPALFSAEPFHNGGTGDCTQCHTTPPELIGADPSSTCLRCHQDQTGIALTSQHLVATNTTSSPLCIQLTPGGDFCWLKKDYSWPVITGMANTQHSIGDKHGHNIIALDYGYGPDSSSAMAPGGTYPSSSLSCISCHDPHGRYRQLDNGTISNTGPPIIASGTYVNSPAPDANSSVGVYRLLAGKGYRPKNAAGAPAFTADPPIAISPVLYNRAETFTDTRVVYGSGMSEWCQNCHPQLDSFCKHPVGSNALFSLKTLNHYNGYLFSGNTSGNQATSYSSLVPYEIGSKDYSVVKMLAATAGSSGPTGRENVMCLSCHRAHASGWGNMLRWNMEAEFIVYEGTFPGIDNNSPPHLAQGRTAAETTKNFYDRRAGSYGQFQRNLCNKCHQRD